MMVTELDTEELVHLSVAKRYSEFLAFHKSWTHKFVGCNSGVCKTHEWCQIPQTRETGFCYASEEMVTATATHLLVPNRVLKCAFRFNNMSEEFINQRRIALETYLQQCKRVAALVPELFRCVFRSCGLHSLTCSADGLRLVILYREWWKRPKTRQTSCTRFV